MNSKWNARCTEAGSDVLVVAERLVLRFAAAAKSDAWQGLDGAVLPADLDLASDQQRPVAHRRYLCRPIGILVLPTVQAPVKQCAARASPHDLGHVVWIGLVRQDPWPAIELEDSGVSTQTFTDVDADVQVKADLDLPTPIDLPHPDQRYERWVTELVPA